MGGGVAGNPRIFEMTGALAGYHLAQQLPRLQAVLVVVCVPVAGQVGISKHGDFTAVHVDSR